MTKILVLFVMIIILVALGSGLFFLVRDEGNSMRTVKALTWRIILSLLLFLFLLISFHFGWLKPHAV